MEPETDISLQSAESAGMGSKAREEHPLAIAAGAIFSGSFLIEGEGLW